MYFIAVQTSEMPIAREPITGRIEIYVSMVSIFHSLLRYHASWHLRIGYITNLFVPGRTQSDRRTLQLTSHKLQFTCNATKKQNGKSSYTNAACIVSQQSVSKPPSFCAKLRLPFGEPLLTTLRSTHSYIRSPVPSLDCSYKRTLAFPRFQHLVWDPSLRLGEASVAWRT